MKSKAGRTAMSPVANCGLLSGCPGAVASPHAEALGPDSVRFNNRALRLRHYGGGGDRVLKISGMANSAVPRALRPRWPRNAKFFVR